jgi:hypothetical protein
MDYFKRNLHQDYVIPFNSIHDEADVGMDTTILEPLARKLSYVVLNKEIFDRYGYNFINTFFDLEYDPYNSFTSSKGIKMTETELPIFKFQEARDSIEDGKQLLKEVDQLIEECKTPIKEVPKVLEEDVKPKKVKSKLELEFPLEEIKPEIEQEKPKEIITKKFQFIFQGEEMLEDISKLDEGTDTIFIKDLREGLYHLPKLVKVTKSIIEKYKATLI